MRLATLHRPDGKTVLVNPENVILLHEPPANDFSSGNCIVIFVNGHQQPVTENLAAAAAMIEGTQLGRSQ